MVKKLSDNKVSKIFDLYFRGYSQISIANKLKITQAAVSMYVSNFKSTAEHEGIEAAAEEYGVMDQVQVLHDLADDLKKAKITAEEAKTGLEMTLLFQKYGFEQEEYGDLIETCEKAKKEDYIFAAVELNQLENSTGMSCEEIIAESKAAAEKLTQNQKELKKTTDELDSVKQKLTNANKQMKLADQDLKTHMQKIGVDENRLKLVETLALTLKKSKIPDSTILEYIERQELLNKAGIDISAFAEILGKAKVFTSDDNGKKLIKMLTEYGGLSGAIIKQESKKQLLDAEVSNLEQLAKLKGKLEGEIDKLKIDKASLQGHVAQLKEQEAQFAAQLNNKKTELGQVLGSIKLAQTAYQELAQKKIGIEDQISKKEKTNSALDEQIKHKQQLVTDLPELESKQQKLLKDNSDMADKVNKDKKRWDVYENFLGFMQSTSLEELQENVKVLPDLLMETEQGKYSPEFLKNYILKELAGPELQILKCTNCQTRFAVDKAAPSGDYKCPIDGMPFTVVDKDAATIIKAALSQAKPKRIIYTAVPMSQIQPGTKHEEKT